MFKSNYLESRDFPGLRAGTDLEAALLLLKEEAGEASIASLPIETRTGILAQTWLKGTPTTFQGGMTAVSYAEHLEPIVGRDALDELKTQGLLSFVI